MPTIVDFPTIVQDALTVFGEVFDTAAARRHFAEYLTGLIVAENKTVSGINREFALTTDQSCLHRWLTEVQWDVKALNDKRLAWLQQAPHTRYSARGVIAIDNTLVTHEGKLIEEVGWFWDHADRRHVIAHDYGIANYVCPSGAHYPLEWRRFQKRDACAEGEFKDHTLLCMELIDDAITRAMPGDFTFDSYLTSAKILNHIQSKQRAYVGDLKLNRKVVDAGREQKLPHSSWVRTRRSTLRPVSSSSPLSTGRAAFTASGAAPEVLLHAYHGASVSISAASTDLHPCLIPSLNL